MSIRTEFIELFDVWPVAQPYLDMMVEPQEMELIVAMQGQSLALVEIAARLGLPVSQTSPVIDRAYSRNLLDKTSEDDQVVYTQTDFGERLDHFGKFENWDDIPAADRKIINQRFLQAFTEIHRPNVERKMRGLSAENALPNDTVMLLHEVEAMINSAEHIVVQPCDCRRLGQICDAPVEVCIWLDAGALDCLDRGHGKQLSREEAIELVRWTDKKGLMHTADSEWKNRDLHAICNCCSCDCYPFLAAEALGSKGVWPKSRYIAAYDPATCSFCGACVKRCPFDAFYHNNVFVEVKGKQRRMVLFNPDLCWGCGLCANTCPEKAIVMDPLEVA